MGRCLRSALLVWTLGTPCSYHPKKHWTQQSQSWCITVYATLPWILIATPSRQSPSFPDAEVITKRCIPNINSCWMLWPVFEPNDSKLVASRLPSYHPTFKTCNAPYSNITPSLRARGLNDHCAHQANLDKAPPCPTAKGNWPSHSVHMIKWGMQR